MNLTPHKPGSATSPTHFGFIDSALTHLFALLNPPESVRRRLAPETKVNDASVVMTEKAFDLAQDAAMTWLG